jgi:hypothetical protein
MLSFVIKIRNTHIFMAMFRFVPPFREAKFFGVPSCVFDKLGCATGEGSLRNTALSYGRRSETSGSNTFWRPSLPNITEQRIIKTELLGCL